MLWDELCADEFYSAKYSSVLMNFIEVQAQKFALQTTQNAFFYF